MMLSLPTAIAGTATNSFVGTWKVNWEKTPVVEKLPEHAYGFKTVEEFREHVARRANDLILDIQTNQTAVLRYADGKIERYQWEISPQAPKYDVWLQTWPHRFSYASVGHGFKVSGTNTAIFTFQLEWNEDVATRVPLVMERQPEGTFVTPPPEATPPRKAKRWWQFWR
ncbi:MAG: hypothetical protein K8R87_09430 [Verrucomicrobia bacterium]|nr:hypothetical protein [Verrucomicrobiota bacterium]